MMHLLAADWLKARKRWMPRIVIILMLAIVGLIFWGTATSVPDRPSVIMPRAWLSAVSFAATLAFVLWPILAGSWAGNEYGWGTARLILSRRPNRVQWVLSAIIVLVAVAGLALLASLIVGSIAGAIVASVTSNSIFLTAGLPDSYWLVVVKGFLGSWYVLAYYIVLAFAAGTIFRSAAVGVGTGIGFPFAQLIASGIFRELGDPWKEIANHFPDAYANALTQRLAMPGETERAATAAPGLPSVSIALLGLTVYVAILLGLTVYLVTARDVTS